jgi:hypothetical protein
MGYILENDVLEIEVANIDAYRGSRFDRTGFITQVRLKDGNHTFCTAERLQPGLGSGGVGICSEFGIFTPIGYDTACVGEPFPKLGVGMLIKPDLTPYDFSSPYPVIPYDVQVETGCEVLQFHTEMEECQGFAASLTKRISIDGARLIIVYLLSNTGNKSIRTEEYTHNFMRIDGHDYGPDYKLTFSFPIEIENIEPVYTPQVLRVSSNDVRINAVPQQDVYFNPTIPSGGNELYWELVHEPSSVGVRETCTFPIDKLAVWGAAHVVSPEVFAVIDLKPGESQTWQRTFDFFLR